MRYVVLAANMRIVDEFRRSRGLRHRDVIGATPANADYTLRGLSGPIEVMTHETWEPSPQVHARVQRNLEIIRLTTRAGS